VDMMTPEGIARALRAYMKIKTGMPAYKLYRSDAVIKVDANLKGIREFSACAIVRNIHWTNEMIKEVMSSHGKIDQTYGRRRKKLGLGVYPLGNIKFPVKYSAEDPKNIIFIPLGFEKEMTVEEIKERHPKGIENAYITEGWTKYPVFRDAQGKIMSCLPFVNSRETGQVTVKTGDVFIEVTGTHWKSVNEVLNIVATSLAERGGKIYTVKMVYGNKSYTTPDLKPAKRRLETEYVNRVFGLQLKAKEICKLLEMMMYGTKILKKNVIEVTIPAIRTDILHDLDIIDDVGRAYGFDNLIPDPPQIPTIGKLHNYSSFSDKSRTTMIGLGFLEMMNFVLTSKEDQFSKMNIPAEDCIEFKNAKDARIDTTRKYIIPELLKSFAYNSHREFPQKIFEVGDVIKIDGSETGASSIRKIAAAIADDKVGYESIASALDAYMRSFGIKYKIVKKQHPSFINGRCGSVIARGKEVGIIGEIHPQVLNNWNLIKPVAAFELNMDEMFSLKK
jgi:phenylalanyl-tRNA synthetase beta chain